MKWINLMMIVPLLLQTVGCSSLRPLKTLEQTEIKAENLRDLSVRLLLKPKSDVPFEEREISCTVLKVTPEVLAVKVSGDRRFDAERKLDINISDIQELEILERKAQKGKTLAALAVAGFLIFFAVSVGSAGGIGPNF